ncbi:PstS family phosphate ABC transporter substrate-binding protein [Nitrosomonas sp. Nm166]|uniref:PstS family phosphate ABC transporter substrate-binding protein n=1 Tax=Nitrosomonas sp. Nm166 TaxID=1881054 RepID=UPI0008E2EFDB|nr:PstS family phosphate ABC transporter substrate-binding protein [Nitrosomonas sp. Nm166]SFF19219.1 phosphate transport system substrate-binding protein [Nitrosomonas sp. Nm166]
MPQLYNIYSLKILILLSTIMSAASANAQPLIKIDGSSTVYPITKTVASKFEIAKRNAVKVTVDISGSGGGFKKFCRGELDIANASRPILKNEMADCKNASVQYIEIPVAFDALTVAVNPENNWSTAMTIAELKKMWEPAAQGKITRWNQINPAWPDEVFRLYGADADSGTFDYFTKAIVGKAKSSRSDFNESKDDNVLVEGVASNKNGLGFFGFAYYIENQNKVTAIAIDNGNGAILPSVETVEDGSYQPLSRPIFIYVNAKAAGKGEVKEFVEFYMKNALLTVKEVKFFPLPPRAYTTMLEHFNKKRVGTVFNGISAVGLTIDDLIRREGRLEYDNY